MEQKIKRAAFKSGSFGAGGRTRTDTVLLKMDFEFYMVIGG